MNSMLAAVGGLSGVRSTLAMFEVSPDVINEIVDVLETTSGTLDSAKFRDVQGTWFGDCQSGHTLGFHTDKAHAKLANAVLEAVAGLQATGDAMRKFDEEVHEADANSSAAARALLRRTDSAIDSMDDDPNTPPTSVGAPGGEH